MKRSVYFIENLDCANCAAKIEAKIRALPEVEDASITFATAQLRITAEDPDSLLETVTAIAQSIEPQVTIRPREEAGHHAEHQAHGHDGCGCGHDHRHHHEGCGHGHDHGHHHEGCSCDHDHEHKHKASSAGHDHDHGEGISLKKLLLGAAAFVLMLLAEEFFPAPVSLLLGIGAYLLLGLPVLKTAAGNLLRGHIFDENFLISIATLGAFAIGEAPEAVGIMLFYQIGTYFEHRAVERSRSQIMDAVDLRPETVTLVLDEELRTIPAADAKIGDILLIRPGDRIPLDGTVLTGESRIDTSPITGEPLPRKAAPGSSLLSGCINTTGQLKLRVEHPLAESMVTRILDSVENAAASKPRIDRFITRFSRIYTPVVVIGAVLTAIIPSLFTGDWNYWVYTALSFLVMSCPCALVLSVPLAFFSGIGVGSKQGILFKGGASIEALAQIRAVAMDKTGTLTKGDFSVQQVEGSEEILSLCAACERYSTHPIASSIVAAANARNLTLPTVESLEELPGRGIRGTVEGKTVLCGSLRLMEESGIPTDAFTDIPAGTVVFVAIDGRAAGYLYIADTVKADSVGAVSRLRSMGIRTAMLTGDEAAVADTVGRQLSVDEVHSRLLPGQKLDVLQGLRKEQGSVMFVGDGINDAIVLAGADVGAAMGSGADAAIEAADVVFMTSAAAAIPESIRIARKTRRIALQNVVVALAIKLIVMVLGLLGHASMWLAVFADSGVAMLCVLNALRLLFSKK